jgi:hypothetical protein
MPYTKQPLPLTPTTPGAELPYPGELGCMPELKSTGNTLSSCYFSPDRVSRHVHVLRPSRACEVEKKIVSEHV